MQPTATAHNVMGGFEGAVSGMSLLDLLQVKGMARFTGRIAVERSGKTGLIFFRDGEVIHAELDKLEGKAAFDAIVVWGGGSFKAEPKVTTTRQTLSDRLHFLLMDAVRLQDEAAAGLQQQEEAAETTRQPGKGETVQERLAGIAGLSGAVLTNRQGTPLQSCGNDAEGLAAQGMYVVTTSERIGELTGLGSFKGALIQGAKAHLVVLEGPKNYLFAAADGEAKPSAVEHDIRHALSGQK